MSYVLEAVKERPLVLRVSLTIAFLAVMSLAGCHAARRIRNCDYAPYCSVARTSPCEVGVASDAGVTEIPPVLTAAVGGALDVPSGPESPAPSSDFLVPNDLDQLTEWALARNPEIGVARQALEMARARLPQAASLDDPMVDVTGWPIYPNVPQTAAGRMTVDVAVSQKIPWLGKRTARVGAEAREASAAASRLAAVEQRLIEELQTAYADWWGAERELALLADDVRLLQEFTAIVDALYQTGKVGQQDLLRLNSEMGKAESEVIRGKARQIQAAAELRRVLYLPPDTALSAAADWTPAAERIGQLDLLLQQALSARPELQAAWAKVQRDQWRVEQTRLEYYPDLTFKFGWGEMTTNRALAPTADGIDNLTTGVNFNVPIRHDRLAGAVREAESQVVAGICELEQLRSETIRDVQQRYADWTSGQSQLLKYRDVVLPRMQQALELTTRAYQVNEADFTDLIEVRRELLTLRRAELQLQIELQKTFAALRRLLVQLPTSDSTADSPSSQPAP